MASLSKQETYRLLMKEKKSKRSGVPRIDHPLAKYNSVGQLSCVICTVSIKSELLWQTHLQSKIHKQNVIELKTLSDSKETVQKPRQTKTGPAPVSNAASSTDDEGFVKPTLPPSRKRRLSSNKEEVEDEIKMKDNLKTEEETVRVVQQVSPITKTEGLPSDFFDAPTTSDINMEDTVQETSKDKAKTEKKETKESNGKDDSGNLPEGFFDNPVVDAKVRKVEYKDPLDEQWEAFRKTISKETDVSQAIIEVDDDEMNQVRELSEINEQVHWYQRAESLRVRQEVKVASMDVKTELDEELKTDVNRNDVKYEGDDDDDDDDADLLDLFDWRFKSS